MSSQFHAGQKFRESFVIDSETVEKFAALSGDTNPLHMIEREAQSYGFRKQVAHGAIQTAFVSRMIGMRVPGSGAVWMNHSIQWLEPIFVGDELTLELEIVEFSESTRILKLGLCGRNQIGHEVMNGSATVRIAQKLSTSEQNTESAEGRVALITGGAGGIGSEIARELARQGYLVGVAYSGSEERARRLVGEIDATGSKAVAIRADFNREGEATELADQIIARWDRLDVIIHGASPKIQPTPIADLGYAAIAEFSEFYLRSAHELVRAAVPGMKERKFGRFIYVGTSYTLGSPPPGLAAYTVAKAALAGYSRALAVELAPSGITSNVVSPGMTLTEFSGHVPPRIKEVEAFKNPTRRLADPDDTAPLVCFLASGVAGYINGANIPVTGGPI